SAEMETGGTRFNIIPKSGGNQFSGLSSFNYMNRHLQSDNLDEALRARGLLNGDRMKYMSDISVSAGGKIVRDHLWFYGGFRDWRTVKFTTSYYDTNSADWIYNADFSRGPVPLESPVHDGTGRLTWQATPKNKFSANILYESRCECELFLSPNVTFDASARTPFPSKLIQGNWVSPVTNRLLLEVGGTAMLSYFDAQPQSTAVGPSALELNGNIEFRARETVPQSQNEAYPGIHWRNY